MTSDSKSNYYPSNSQLEQCADLGDLKTSVQNEKNDVFNQNFKSLDKFNRIELQNKTHHLSPVNYLTPVKSSIVCHLSNINFMIQIRRVLYLSE